MTKYVYDFSEGNKDMKDLLGGKGANLAEMTNMGLPVPPGFTITTEACLTYLAEGGHPAGLMDEVDEHLAALEASMGKTLGDAGDPLLVSVRSGAKFSMPGMMDTVLNLGLNDASVEGLAEQTGDDAVRVRLLPPVRPDVRQDRDGRAGRRVRARARRGQGARRVRTRRTPTWTPTTCRALTERFKAIYREHTGLGLPDRPEGAAARWRSRRSSSAGTASARVDYRRQNKISDDLGTAVNVVAMVFGNRGDDSGTGVAFTRDPSTGENVPYGDYLANAQGEDVVAGIRNTLPLAKLEELDPASYKGLREVMDTLEGHYRDMCDIEFTIEKGRLWILQTRVGKRTAFGEWVMADEMLERGPDRRGRGRAARRREPPRGAVQAAGRGRRRRARSPPG